MLCPCIGQNEFETGQIILDWIKNVFSPLNFRAGKNNSKNNFWPKEEQRTSFFTCLSCLLYFCWSLLLGMNCRFYHFFRQFHVCLAGSWWILWTENGKNSDILACLWTYRNISFFSLLWTMSLAMALQYFWKHHAWNIILEDRSYWLCYTISIWPKVGFM